MLCKKFKNAGQAGSFDFCAILNHVAQESTVKNYITEPNYVCDGAWFCGGRGSKIDDSDVLDQQYHVYFPSWDIQPYEKYNSNQSIDISLNLH